MKVSLNWIKEFTTIPANHIDLLDKISEQIGEVEQVIDYSEIYRNCVLGEIMDAQDHPDSEKLGVYRVNDGKTERTIVAGDKTLKKGDKVALFLPGAVVPNNQYPDKFDGVVKEVKLRGVTSEGMMASMKELNIGNDHEKVMRLDVDDPPGTPIAEVLEMDDIVVEIENKALTNRADLFGMIGMSREIAGIQGVIFTSPDWYRSDHIEDLKKTERSLDVSVSIEDADLCTRFYAISMSDIKIGESPLWLRSRLLMNGIRPISNVVDITNYIMLLFGQPMHAYDFDKIIKKDNKSKDRATIIVRRAKKGERITALDDQTHELSEDNLVICDSEHPIGIGGIIGGFDTEVDENTQNILLEAANFDMYNIRKSSMQLGVFTDAVTRFSKGQDPNKAQPAIYFGAKLVQELANGKVSKVVDTYPGRKEHEKVKEISFEIGQLNRHLGTDISETDALKVLNGVELTTVKEADRLTTSVPTYRRDIVEKVDIYEDVGRLIGYNKIPVSLPNRSIKAVVHNKLIDHKERVREILKNEGANEVLTYSFTSKQRLVNWNLNPLNSYRLINSLSPELEYMRLSLLPSLAEKARKNLDRMERFFVLYEMNHTHDKRMIGEDSLPYEFQSLSLLLAGSTDHTKSHLDNSAYYYAKNYLDSLSENLNIRRIKYSHPQMLNVELLPEWIKTRLDFFDPNAVAVVSYESDGGDLYLGVIGEIHLEILTKEKLPDFTAGFEIDLELLSSLSSDLSYYSEPSQFPYSTIDLCFVVDKDTPYEAIQNTALESIEDIKDLDTHIEPLDIYSNESVKIQGKKYVTIRLKAREYEKTISKETIKELSEKIIVSISKNFDATLKD